MRILRFLKARIRHIAAVKRGERLYTFDELKAAMVELANEATWGGDNDSMSFRWEVTDAINCALFEIKEKGLEHYIQTRRRSGTLLNDGYDKYRGVGYGYLYVDSDGIHDLTSNTIRSTCRG